MLIVEEVFILMGTLIYQIIIFKAHFFYLIRLQSVQTILKNILLFYVC